MITIVENWAEKHSVLSVTLLHMAVGVGFIGAVSGIALTGGAVIWMAYRLLGII